MNVSLISLEDMRRVHGRRQDGERDREASETYCFVIFCFWIALSQRRKVVDKKKKKEAGGGGGKQHNVHCLHFPLI